MGRAGEYIQKRIREEDRGFYTPCWVWQLKLTEKGYARADVPEFGRVRVHRAAYEIHVGPIPEGLVIDHLCRVPACCNPTHLEPVTSGENSRRGYHATKSFCKRGHELFGDNVSVGKNGWRMCRTCHRDNRRVYMRAWRAR